MVRDRCNFLPGSAASVNLQATLCAIIHRWFSFPDTSFFIFLAQSTYSDTFDYLCNLHASPAHRRVLCMCICVHSEVLYILFFVDMLSSRGCVSSKFYFILHTNGIRNQVTARLQFSRLPFSNFHNCAFTILFFCPRRDFSSLTDII